MQPEIRSCKKCSANFQIQPEDFAFYEKIKVPPPTHCPDCRLQRRMTWRNERGLYKRTCSKCAKNIFGMYPAETPFPVYCHACWWSDSWDPLEYGQDFDFSKPFFEQFKQLQKTVPRLISNNFNESSMLNSPFNNCAGDLKNCYLVIGAMGDENCSYCHYTNYSKDCFDCLFVNKSEYCYECFDCEQCYSLLYSQSCTGCRDSYFLFDCKNVSDSIGCIGLRNAQYHILNQPYAKEEYFTKKAELGLDTRVGRDAFAQKFRESELFKKFPRKYYHGQMNGAFSGDYISEGENTLHTFYSRKTRDSKYCFWYEYAENCYDCFTWGQMEWMYECMCVGLQAANCAFLSSSWGSIQNLYYSDICYNGSKNLFGCIGLRGKENCILNKQYSKEEYAELSERIREHMVKTGEYGEFFPIALSPFPYWDTVAQEHFPLSKEEIGQKGYQWREPDTKAQVPTLQWSNLPNSISETDDSILKQIISCEHGGNCADQCTIAFRLTPVELQFYRDKNIPPPRRCFQCRHAARINLRNPLKLWPRECMCAQAKHFHGPEKCPNNFETSYAPYQQEIIYCEQCYNSEVA